MEKVRPWQGCGVLIFLWDSDSRFFLKIGLRLLFRHWARIHFWDSDSAPLGVTYCE